jgi:hypothetical protein
LENDNITTDKKKHEGEMDKIRGYTVLIIIPACLKPSPAKVATQNNSLSSSSSFSSSVKASKNSKNIVEEHCVKVLLFIGGGVERYRRFDADDSIVAVHVSVVEAKSLQARYDYFPCFCRHS